MGSAAGKVRGRGREVSGSMRGGKWEAAWGREVGGCMGRKEE